MQTADNNDLSGGSKQSEPIECVYAPAVGQKEIEKNCPYSFVVQSFEPSGESSNPIEFRWAFTCGNHGCFKGFGVAGITIDEKQTVVGIPNGRLLHNTLKPRTGSRLSGLGHFLICALSINGETR
jgi:hypothetical protein